MKKRSFLYFLSFSLLIISCGSNEECKDCEIESNKDTVAEVDNITTALQDTAVEKKSVAVENKENHDVGFMAPVLIGSQQRPNQQHGGPGSAHK